MNTTLKTLLVTACLALSVAACAPQASSDNMAAQDTTTVSGKQCPMKKCAMRADMKKMAEDMQGMMDQEKDPAMKAKMQKMHDDMEAMTKKMEKCSKHKGSKKAAASTAKKTTDKTKK